MVVIFLGWYPGSLAGAQGVNQLVLILIGVDVVIGPLITTLIYVPGKWGLRFDLCVIAAMQTTALLYGLEAIHGGRPAYVVFNVDRFDVVAYQDVNRESLARAPEGFGIRLLGPQTVGAQLPQDLQAKSEILFSAIAGGADLPQFPEYFVSLASVQGSMILKQHPLDELRTINEMSDEQWAAFIASLGRPEAEMGYLPMAANRKDGAVVIDSKTGEILDIALLTPRFGPPPGEGGLVPGKKKRGKKRAPSSIIG